MVSFNPTTIYSMDPLKTGLPGLSTFPRSQPITEPYSGGNTMSFSGDQVIEDAKKKIRKPYTITKSRESWTEHEHDKFLEALQLFDRDWKKIEAFVGSKNVIQIRSHAQKYFLKVQKNGTNVHVPPPRPKRKAAHPYPQKASKTETVVSRIAQPFQAASALTEHSYACQPDSPSVLRNPVNSGNLPSWGSSTVPPVVMSQVNRDDGGYVGSPIMYNCCYGSSNESTPRAWQADQWDQLKRMRAMPDFAQVYNFIGSVFDPNASGHLKRLKHMDPINMETAVLLMRNLSVNLTSPEFENHRRLLAAHVQAEGKCSTPCRSSASDNKPGCVVPAM